MADDDAAAPMVGDVVFALTPATHVTGLLNFVRTDHHKIFKSGIKSVETAYDCELEGLFQFLREIRDCATQIGWMDSILNVDISEDDDG